MKDLTVFILTHNRPVLVQKAIESVLKQKPFDFTLIVSDNSDNNETEEILKTKSYFDKINYYHINANGIDRYKDLFSRTKTKYFMQFHDDDEMLPDMVNSLYKAIVKGKYAAVSSNAYVVRNGVIAGVYNKYGTNIIVRNLDFLVKAYAGNGLTPFPAYMYSFDCISVFPWEFPGGKYSDACFMVNILTKVGNILWLKNKLMNYYYHNGQDSAVYDYIAGYNLYCYFKKNSFNKKSKALKQYRSYLLYSLIQQSYKDTGKVSGVKLRLLFKSSLYLYLKWQLKKIVLVIRNKELDI